MGAATDGPNLQLLKAAAEAVPARNWEVWPNVHGDPIVVEAGGRGQFAEICTVSTRFADYGRNVAAFITAADPDTVLTLIARLEAAEAGAGRECLCGTMLRDKTVQCRIHPDVRPRTVRERIDFEQAFDSALERSLSNTQEPASLGNPNQRKK
ncbi:hypothetical protein [Arthrobacter sp. zg-Y1110]|uniref:hypothetical protein n=1 Tax=Arthrobacter sp. zg-Y1110 TaxID=2886932 RepID=UPI001D1376C5|nr:hypothetical protein [Arthrobacter sp. zg-Y1110]MCC3292960.1 hypothetical protein [Arthrobacter sp. zg-Y1110]UWX86899.1 hypothetical protein N2K99_18825 [Arthrobacter sp. zg-Y1110]